MTTSDPGHNKWPKIGKFSDITWPLTNVLLRPKVKLHGTNAAVRVTLHEDGTHTVVAQSRERDLTIASDNYGFAAWVAAGAGDAFVEVVKDLRAAPGTVTVFGEWCGPGVNTGEACSRIPRRMFFVFGVQTSTGGHYVEPDVLDAYIPEHADVHVIPWFCGSHKVNMADRNSLEEFSTWASTAVEAVGAQDPFILGLFGIDGPGEGLVFYSRGVTSYEGWPAMFKGKSSAHTNKPAKVRAPVSVSPETAAGAAQFAETFLDEARLLQGVEAIGSVYDKARTGDFMRWINADVAAETAKELAASNLTWSDVAKQVNRRASAWYLARCESAL